MLKIGEFSKLAQVSTKTLRHYDQYGLFRPAWIDRFSGYRYYTLSQLPRLNRILTLKDLGFSLEQIGAIMVEQRLSGNELLQGMMRLKRDELQAHIGAEQARLGRIEARLQQLEQADALPPPEVLVKSVPAVQVAGVRDLVAEYGPARAMARELNQFLQDRGLFQEAARPWIGVYHDTEFQDDGVHMELAAPLTQPLPGTDRVIIHELPGVENMACLLFEGPFGRLREAHQSLFIWLENSGYQADGPSRDVYLQRPSAHGPNAGGMVEVQLAVQPQPYLSTPLSYKEKQKMEPTIENKEAFTVVGLNYHGKNENNDLPGLWQEFLPRFQEIPNLTQPYQSYGVCGSVEEDGRFRYLAGFEIEAESDLPKGMASWQVPAQTYAVFPCTLATIADTYNYAFQTWLPGSDYEHVDAPDFEYYPPGIEPEKEMYVYIPVKEKK